MNDLIELYAPAYHDGIIATLILAATVVAALILQRALFASLQRTLRNKDDGIFAALLRRAQAPAGFALPLIAARIALPYLTFPERLSTALVRVTAVASTIAVAWAIIASIGLYTDLVKRRYNLADDDNLRARQVETRIDILARSVIIVVMIVAASLAAMTIPSIRTI